MGRANKSGMASKRRTATRKPAKPLGVAERRADDRLVSKTIAVLARHDRRVAASLREVGEHVLRTYFGNDPKLAQSNDPTKARSYARLAARAEAETDWSVDDFRRAVRIAVVARSLPENVAQKLAPSKLLRLYAVDDAAARAVLAKRVADGEVDEDGFRVAVAKLAGTDRRGGRERVPGVVRLITSVERAVELADEADAFDAAEIARVPESARDALRRRARDAIERLESLVRFLG